MGAPLKNSSHPSQWFERIHQRVLVARSICRETPTDVWSMGGMKRQTAARTTAPLPLPSGDRHHGDVSTSNICSGGASSSLPRAAKRRRAPLVLVQRETTDLHVAPGTLHCAHSGCTPCIYKLVLQCEKRQRGDGGDQQQLRPNERPECCMRYTAGASSLTTDDDPVAARVVRCCGLYR
eukprot:SAG11_NODE_12851_length_682_cov_1.277873_1_plen_178_part_10